MFCPNCLGVITPDQEYTGEEEPPPAAQSCEDWLAAAMDPHSLTRSMVCSNRCLEECRATYEANDRAVQKHIAMDANVEKAWRYLHDELGRLATKLRYRHGQYLFAIRIEKFRETVPLHNPEAISSWNEKALELGEMVENKIQELEPSKAA